MNKFTFKRQLALLCLLFAQTACLVPVNALELSSEAFRNTDQTGSQTLKILFHRKFQDGFGIDEVEKRLVEKFAENNGLVPEWVEKEEPWQLLPALNRAEGDIIVSEGYDVSGGIHGVVSFTNAWAASRHQVVTRDETQVINSLDDLSVRQVVIKTGSPVQSQIERLSARNELMELVLLDENFSEDEILSRVSSGEFDVAVMDGDYIKDNLNRYPQLNASFNLTADTRKVWAVSPAEEELKQALNNYLNKEHLSLQNSSINHRDFSEIRKYGSLRAITYQSPGNVFYKNGKFSGFQYDLIKSFAKKHKLQLDIILAKSEEEMLRLLAEGKGDVVAAFVPEDNRNASPGQEQFIESDAYYFSSPVIVGRKNDKEHIIDIRDLESRSIAVSSESPYITLLKRLKKKHNLDFQIKVVDSAINTEKLLFMVSLGMHDLTILPSHQLRSELSRQVNLSGQLHIEEPVKNVWLVRKESTLLERALNVHISSVYRSLTYNALRKKYITNPVNIRGNSRLLTQIEQLTPFDNLILEAAEEFHFDWRLIAAQMYQESRFDTAAVSSAGAEGLMQLMPATANDLGVNETNSPFENIRAGVRYLQQLRDQFEDDLLLEEKTWFALASYNAGLQRVIRARKLAAEMGLNENKWFDNVEVAMNRMAKTPINDEGKTICRCGEAIAYVRDIRTRYNNYVSLTNSLEVAQSFRNKSRTTINKPL